MEQTITFALLKSLALYVAALVPNHTTIVTAIAKAATGAELTDNINVTILESEVVTIFNQLTVQPEGVAALNNDALENVLLPLLADRPDLAAQIMAIKESNAAQREALVNTGAALVEKIQQAITNN